MFEECHVLEARLQQRHEFRFGHFTQVIRIVSIVRSEARIRCGNNEFSRRLEQVCDAANDRFLCLKIDVLDHLEASHQIEGSRRQPSPEIGAPLKDQARVSMHLSGPVQRLRRDVQPNNRFGY